MRALLALALPIALTACGGGGGSAPAGESPAEAKALDEAAEMIEARRLPDDALKAPQAPPSAPANQ